MSVTVTPAQLALELGVSSKRVRDVLRRRYGTLPSDAARWELTHEMANHVRQQLPPVPVPARSFTDWLLEPGETVKRRELHDRYNGSRQNGIVTLGDSPQILVFTDPVKGARHGYDRFEGLLEDGSYSYTGEGQVGDQQFTRGNLAIRDSAINGKTIRLFTTRGVYATYIGAFTTGEPPYRLAQIPDTNNELRQGIIFNLVPVEADVVRLPPRAGLDPAAGIVESAWAPPNAEDVATAEGQQHPAESTITRVEHALQARFGEWLTGEGATPRLLKIAAGASMIEPDLYVPGWSWMVEAKKSSGRAYVRMAIGQVLDYVHAAQAHGLQAKPVILLPGLPEPDLRDLISLHGITLAVHPEGGDVLIHRPDV